MDDDESRIITQKISQEFERKIVQLDNLMVVVCDFSNGPMLTPEPPHSHPHEQITFVAEGELHFFKGSTRHTLSGGDVIAIPPGIPHCIQTISPFVRLVDSFTPIRKDFISPL